MNSRVAFFWSMLRYRIKQLKYREELEMSIEECGSKFEATITNLETQEVVWSFSPTITGRMVRAGQRAIARIENED